MPVGQDDYNAVPYPCSAHSTTHPDQVAVMALLHGLDPAPVDRCRVLEVGCNDGGNLIPMAYGLPNSEFVGFDLASQPIDLGQRRIAQLGLTNIRLFQADLMEVAEDLGTFDYILAHGVYAWVPEPVGEGLLAFCKRHLAADGVAFVSYNALPGGHLRNMMREMLLESPSAGLDPVANMEHAIRCIEFFIASRPADDPHRAVLEREIKHVKKKRPHVLFHDELSTFYRPVSFSTFVAHAARHGLQYVSEAELPPPTDPVYKPEVAGPIKTMANGDRLAEEQMLDFARMRMYRETLLCHAGHAVDSDVQFSALDRLRLASQAEATEAKGGLRTYVLPGGLRIESEHTPTMLLMDLLIRAWPRSVPLLEVGVYLERQGVAFSGDILLLLLRLLVSRVVELHTWQAPVADVIPERPRASAVSRDEARTHERAATLLHVTIGLNDPVVRQLLLLLDGSRDRAVLLQALRSHFPDVAEATLEEGIDPTLRLLHSTGVLMAEDFPRP